MTVWGRVGLRIGAGPDVSISVPFSPSLLRVFIGQRVARAAVVDGASLTLEFETGDSILVVEDTDEYECFELRVGSRSIIV